MPKLYPEELLRLTNELSQHLPEGWSPHDTHPAINGPDGMCLLLANGRPRGRVEGLLPSVPNHCFSLSEEQHRQASIGVNLTRSPEAIARDITRRLLPQYEPLFRDVAEARQEYEQQQADRQDLADRAGQLFSEPHHVCAFTSSLVEVTLVLDAEQLEAVATIVS